MMERQDQMSATVETISGRLDAIDELMVTERNTMSHWLDDIDNQQQDFGSELQAIKTQGNELKVSLLLSHLTHLKGARNDCLGMIGIKAVMIII